MSQTKSISSQTTILMQINSVNSMLRVTRELAAVKIGVSHVRAYHARHLHTDCLWTERTFLVRFSQKMIPSTEVTLLFSTLMRLLFILNIVAWYTKWGQCACASWLTWPNCMKLSFSQQRIKPTLTSSSTSLIQTALLSSIDFTVNIRHRLKVPSSRTLRDLAVPSNVF